MVRLSVNVNKVATLRNSRGGRSPSVIDAVGVCVAAGAPGITVHPRADRRHITPDDVREIAAVLRTLPPAVEFNIEGDPRAELLDLVEEVRPDQCTLVPVVPGEVTSQAGWQPGPERDRLPERGRTAQGARHPRQPVRRRRARSHPVGGIGRCRPGRVVYRAFRAGVRAWSGARARCRSRSTRKRASLANSLGLAVNAGHDLDLDNLVMFRELPFLAEVSIGHALMSRALFVGLDAAVREYLAVLL